MTDHVCNHEQDFGRFKQVCDSEIPEIKKLLGIILDKINGTNGSGLATRLAINEMAISDLVKNFPGLKKILLWGSIWGGISGGMTIGLFFGIKSFF